MITITLSTVLATWYVSPSDFFFFSPLPPIRAPPSHRSDFFFSPLPPTRAPPSHRSAPREILTPQYIPKRAKVDKSLEVVFDPQAHRAYVTGFRKRKNERRKEAVVALAKRAASERLESRKTERSEFLKRIGLSERDMTDAVQEAEAELGPSSSKSRREGDHDDEDDEQGQIDGDRDLPHHRVKHEVKNVSMQSGEMATVTVQMIGDSDDDEEGGRPTWGGDRGPGGKEEEKEDDADEEWERRKQKEKKREELAAERRATKAASEKIKRRMASGSMTKMGIKGARSKKDRESGKGHGPRGRAKMRPGKAAKKRGK